MPIEWEVIERGGAGRVVTEVRKGNSLPKLMPKVKTGHEMRDEVMQEGMRFAKRYGSVTVKELENHLFWIMVHNYKRYGMGRVTFSAARTLAHAFGAAVLGVEVDPDA